MKAHTDLEQSKKLAEILPIESADMWYDNNGESIAGRPEIRTCSFVGLASKNIPCWSLSALLSFLPRPDLHQTREGKWCCIAEPNSMIFSRHFDNPVDACADMIVKLKEQDFI